MMKLWMPDNWNGILLVTDAPTNEDVKSGYPLRGSQGLLLQKLCSEAGIDYKRCAKFTAYHQPLKREKGDGIFVTKTQWKKNPEDYEEVGGSYITQEAYLNFKLLQNTIRSIAPKFLYSFGSLPLLALAGESSIDDWRGSQLEYEGIPWIPTYSMARVNKQMQLKFLVRHDLGRGVRKDFKWNFKKNNFVINPTYQQAYTLLLALYERAERGELIAVDIETRWQRHISYIGFAWSEHDAICIPLIRPADLGPYWQEQYEQEIVYNIKSLLEHPNVKVAGQNYHYDAVFLSRNWGVRNHIFCDTMVDFHSTFSADINKNLALLSSLFCEDYVYWKDESENHEPTVEGENAYQEYNCKDACNTWEIARGMHDDNLNYIFGNTTARDFQSNMWNPLLAVMLRGVNTNLETRKAIYNETREKIKFCVDKILYFVPPEVYDPPMKKFPQNTTSEKVKKEMETARIKYTGWWNSPAKVAAFFYDVMNVPPVTKRNKQTGQWGRTADDDALEKIEQREPLLAIVAYYIAQYRSLCKFLDFTMSKPSDDGRMRTSYGLAGTSTYRLSSSTDQFDTGMNLMNLPKGDG